METMKKSRGKGRVFTHGNSWWIDISFGGKRRRERIAPIHPDKELNKKVKKQAEAVLAKRIMEIAENRFLDVKLDCRITFAMLADKYLAWTKENHRSNSDVYYVRPLKERFGNRLISDISREDVDRYKTWRLEQDAGNCTINHELITLSSMFNLAIKRWEHPENKREPLYDGRNPAEGFEKLDEEPRTRYLTKGELVTLVDHILKRLGLVEDHNPDKSKRIRKITNGRDLYGYRRLLDFIMIAVTTGMRKGEIQSLRYGSKDIRFSDDDPMENYVRLPGKRTKNGKERKVFLNRISRAILSKEFDFSYEPRHLWGRVRKEVGLEDVTIHDFRRTFATYLNQIGVNAFTLAALMGHQVPGFDVTSIYARPDLESMKEAIDRLETHLVELIPVIRGTTTAQSEKSTVAESCASRYN
ncbi:MAG TPA: site-specific integrase [Candidatus Omnitrophota bacterium]|nr:site-specific integrase [Candidatus Omnitrophota bacterium]